LRNLKLAGSTPTISRGRPSIVMPRPMTDGSPPERRLDAQHAERAVGDEQALHALGLADPGHGHGRVVPHPDVVEGLPLVAVYEIGRGGLVQERDVHPGRGVPHADEAFRLVERQRLQQHAVDDAEDRRVRAEAEAERENGYGAEERRAEQPARDEADPDRDEGHARVRRKKVPGWFVLTAVSSPASAPRASAV
jgi:hypothetical protein